MSFGASPAGRAAYRFTSVRAPFGPVRVTESDLGLVSVELIPAPVAALVERLRPLSSEEAPELSEVTEHESSEAISRYFASGQRSFAVPIDWSLCRGFVRRVLECLARLPERSTTTYGELSRAAGGGAGAARAVGGAMAKNPLPIVVPCHRVLAANARLGGFTGGPDIKRWLLWREGFTVKDDGVVVPGLGSESALLARAPWFSARG